LAKPFVDEPRYGLERVGTAKKGLCVIYALTIPGSTAACVMLDEDESLTRPARSLTRR
jgi:hypothetical protein